MDTAQYITAGVLVALSGLVGVALTLATLSGAWLTLLVALLIQWWRPDTFHWGTLLAAAILSGLGEVVEFAAGGVGAAGAGGSRRSVALAIVGGVVGAIAGTFLIPVPIIGTIIGAVIGAGACAMLGERSKEGRSWRQSWDVGRGAAVGRAMAIVIKTVFAAAVGVLLTVAAFLP